MTTETTPFLDVLFTHEDGHNGRLYASKVETVWGDEDRGEFAGFIFTEYQTGKIWKIESRNVSAIKKGCMWIELA
jgi:hypothetical protein